MSPTKLLTVSTLTGVATATKIICVIFEVATDRDLIQDDISSLMTLAVAICWLTLCTCCLAHRVDQSTRDALNQANTSLAATADTMVERIETRITAAIDEAGDRGSIAGTIATMAEAKKTWLHEPRRPHLVET